MNWLIRLAPQRPPIIHRHAALLLFLGAFTPAIQAQQSWQALPPLTYSPNPAFPQITVTGTPETVYDYDDDGAILINNGDVNVFPDLPARAFQDASGRVSLTIPMAGKGPDNSPNGGNIRMSGPDLDSLTLDPGQHGRYYMLRSDADPQRCNFNDAEWVASTWFENGLLHAVVHMEFEANTHTQSDYPDTPNCDFCEIEDDCCNGILDVPGTNFLFCQITNLTQAISFDGGSTLLQHDDVPALGQNHPALIANGPYEFDSDPSDLVPPAGLPVNPEARVPYQGYTVPSNIFRHPLDPDGYYMLVKQHVPTKFFNDTGLGWAVPLQIGGSFAPAFHSTLLRTEDLSDASSWRAYSGGLQNGLPICNNVLPDPYRDGEPADPETAVGVPLDEDYFTGEENAELAVISASVTWNTYLNRFLAIDWGPVAQADGSYVQVPLFSLSEDLVNWTPISQIQGLTKPFTEPNGDPSFNSNPLYLSLIDRDHGPNFEVSDQTAELYYAWNPGGSAREDLNRVTVTITKPIDWE